MLINLQLLTGVNEKTNRPWFMVRTVAGKYSGEPVFVSQLEYDYLKDLIAKAQSNSGIDLDNEEA